MSLSLFNVVPAGSIEVLTDAKGSPYFKRADIGKYLEIADVKAAYRDVCTTPREKLLEGVCQTHPSQRQNDHDAFVTLDAALEIVVRSRKPKAVEMVKWLTRKGVEKVLNEERHKVQKTIDEKDTQLALLNDGLNNSKDLVRHLEFNNTGLQGEIRAKDQIVQDLIANRHVPRRHPIDNILCFIDKKSDSEKYELYAIRCQRKTLEKHKRWLRNRYPDMVILGECDDGNAVHRWCRFKKDAIPDAYRRNHFNLDDEARELFETAFDIEI